MARVVAGGEVCSEGALDTLKGILEAVMDYTDDQEALEVEMTDDERMDFWDTLTGNFVVLFLFLVLWLWPLLLLGAWEALR